MAGKKAKSPPPKDNVFRLKLPANSENLDIIRKFISGIAGNVGFTEEEVYQIELAVDEACANVIKHAYANEQDNKEKNIHVNVQKNPDRDL